MNWVWIDLAALPQRTYQYFTNRGGLPYKPGGYSEVSSPITITLLYPNFQKRLINDNADEKKIKRREILYLRAAM